MSGARDLRRAAILAGAAVFIAAIAARLGYLSMIELSPSYDVTQNRGSDDYRFFVWALSMVESGDWIGKGLFNQSPLYPYFLAVIFKFTGGNLILPRLVQMVMGSCTALVIFLIGLRLRGPRAGLIAGLIAALYGPLILYDGAFLREGMLCFLYTLFVYLLILGAKKPGIGRGFAAGAVFAIAILGKPTIAIMIFYLPLWLWRAREKGAGKAPRLAAGFAAGLILFISPLLVRNVMAGVPAASLTSRGPLELIEGNHPEAEARGWNITPGIERMERQSNGSLFRAGILVVSAWRDNPAGFPLRLLKKTWMLFDGYEVPKELNFDIERRYVPFFRLPWINWAVLLGLCLVGIFLTRKQAREFETVNAYLVLYSIGILAFYVISAFRLPLAPLMCVPAGAGLDRMIELLSARKIKPAAAALAAVIVIAAVTWPRPTERIGVNEYHNLVRYHVIRNEPARAREISDEAIAEAKAMLERDDTGANHYRLARLEFLAGAGLDEVAGELARARRPDNPAWLPPLIGEFERVIGRKRGDGDVKALGFRL